MKLPQITINVDPRTMAILSAVGTAALVGVVGTLAQILGGGRLELTSADVARLAAAGLSAGLAAYAQSARATTPVTPAPVPPAPTPAQTGGS